MKLLQQYLQAANVPFNVLTYADGTSAISTSSPIVINGALVANLPLVTSGALSAVDASMRLSAVVNTGALAINLGTGALVAAPVESNFMEQGALGTLDIANNGYPIYSVLNSVGAAALLDAPSGDPGVISQSHAEALGWRILATGPVADALAAVAGTTGASWNLGAPGALPYAGYYYYTDQNGGYGFGGTASAPGPNPSFIAATDEYWGGWAYANGANGLLRAQYTGPVGPTAAQQAQWEAVGLWSTNTATVLSQYGLTLNPYDRANLLLGDGWMTCVQYVHGSVTFSTEPIASIAAGVYTTAYNWRIARTTGPQSYMVGSPGVAKLITLATTDPNFSTGLSSTSLANFTSVINDLTVNPFDAYYQFYQPGVLAQALQSWHSGWSALQNSQPLTPDGRVTVGAFNAQFANNRYHAFAFATPRPGSALRATPGSIWEASVTTTTSTSGIVTSTPSFVEAGTSTPIYTSIGSWFAPGDVLVTATQAIQDQLETLLLTPSTTGAGVVPTMIAVPVTNTSGVITDITFYSPPSGLSLTLPLAPATVTAIPTWSANSYAAGYRPVNQTILLLESTHDTTNQDSGTDTLLQQVVNYVLQSGDQTTAVQITDGFGLSGLNIIAIAALVTQQPDAAAHPPIPLFYQNQSANQQCENFVGVSVQPSTQLQQLLLSIRQIEQAVANT